jgi:hypothetical protein
LFLSSSLLPLFPSCTVFALFLLFYPPPYSFFFCFLKKTLPIATECHAVTQIIKSLRDCYCRSNGRRRFVGLKQRSRFLD